MDITVPFIDVELESFDQRLVSENMQKNDTFSCQEKEKKITHYRRADEDGDPLVVQPGRLGGPII